MRAGGGGASPPGEIAGLCPQKMKTAFLPLPLGEGRGEGPRISGKLRVIYFFRVYSIENISCSILSSPIMDIVEV